MAESHVAIKGYIQDLPSGSLSINVPEIVNTNPPKYIFQVTLISGDNTIVVPTNSKGCIVVPDATSTTIKKLKGVAGDTGIIVSKILPNLISFDTTPINSFIINSSALDTVVTVILFF